LPQDRRIRIAPSILTADFARLADEIVAVEAGGIELLHLDVMDGHFVPNISFGPAIVERIRSVTDVVLDTHLMISEPLRYVEEFSNAGADHLTFHVEATTEPQAVIDKIRGLGKTVGISINPATPIDSVVGLLDIVDMVLVMTVEPGFGGQKMTEGALRKASDLRSIMAPSKWLEVDGGVNRTTIARAVSSGADTIVAGSAVFGRGDPASAVEELARLAGEALQNPV
jgi:ribulose-phosphate 3-epimerase